jgi:hypothetical protein
VDIEKQEKQDEQEEQKRCVFCGEKILAIAKKCKHCGEILDVVLRAAFEADKNENSKVFINNNNPSSPPVIVKKDEADLAGCLVWIIGFVIFAAIFGKH